MYIFFYGLLLLKVLYSAKVVIYCFILKCFLIGFKKIG